VVFFAIDGRTGYWRTQHGVFAVDLDTGDERQVTTATGDELLDFTIYSVEDGVIAFTPDGGTTMLAGSSVEDARELLDDQDYPLSRTTDPLLSPTGAWLSVGRAEVSEGDTESATAAADVYDVGTGERVTLELPDVGLAVPGVWLDDDTLQVLAIDGPVEASSAVAHGAAFYTCTVPRRGPGRAGLQPGVSRRPLVRAHRRAGPVVRPGPTRRRGGPSGRGPARMRHA
jgi:hypothetical protein